MIIIQIFWVLELSGLFRRIDEFQVFKGVKTCRGAFGGALNNVYQGLLAGCTWSGIRTDLPPTMQPPIFTDVRKH